MRIYLLATGLLALAIIAKVFGFIVAAFGTLAVSL